MNKQHVWLDFFEESCSLFYIFSYPSNRLYGCRGKPLKTASHELLPLLNKRTSEHCMSLCFHKHSCTVDLQNVKLSSIGISLFLNNRISFASNSRITKLPELRNGNSSTIFFTLQVSLSSDHQEDCYSFLDNVIFWDINLFRSSGQGWIFYAVRNNPSPWMCCKADRYVWNCLENSSIPYIFP